MRLVEIIAAAIAEANVRFLSKGIKRNKTKVIMKVLSKKEQDIKSIFMKKNKQVFSTSLFSFFPPTKFILEMSIERSS